MWEAKGKPPPPRPPPPSRGIYLEEFPVQIFTFFEGPPPPKQQEEAEEEEKKEEEWKSEYNAMQVRGVESNEALVIRIDTTYANSLYLLVSLSTSTKSRFVAPNAHRRKFLSLH